ncbi:ras-related protein RHN1-like [Beta vulgaris subsp. vulgaris]|uniref:ras-related protein RHN1-like n=1 Tax=Beta vulgaris subsp. vulgaris TaxID=3555 RepID=UPI000901EC5B|nr:ras-related protein RHN1-like [Beta vulgaris subsp. vulgaris]
MAESDSKVVQAKLVLQGDMGTGKTSLVLQYVRGQFFDSQEATIGAAYFTKTISFDEASIKFDIWDTAGQERYHSLAPMYYRNATAALLVYDISNMPNIARDEGKAWSEKILGDAIVDSWTDKVFEASMDGTRLSSGWNCD